MTHNSRGRTGPELVSHYKDQIIHSSSPEAFEGAVSTLLSQLHSSGTGLLGRDTKISSRNSISASFRRIPDTPDGDRWVFQDVQPGGVAERAGIRPADVLISIDCKAALPPEQPDFEMAKGIPIVISRNGEHTQVHLELRIPGPKYRSNPYSEPQSAVAKMINDDLGYLKVSLFPGMIGIDFANLLDTLFDGTLQKAQRLIIDLRGNPGGGIGGIRLMSYLTADKRPIGYTLDQKCTIEGRCDPQGLPRFGRIPKTVPPFLTCAPGWASLPKTSRSWRISSHYEAGTARESLREIDFALVLLFCGLFVVTTGLKKTVFTPNVLDYAKQFHLDSASLGLARARRRLAISRSSAP